MEFLKDFYVPVICGVCLCVGYVIKKWLKDIDNKYIPTVNAILGVILALWIKGWALTPEMLLGGLFSGLSATGMYEAFRQYLENKNALPKAEMGESTESSEEK